MQTSSFNTDHSYNYRDGFPVGYSNNEDAAACCDQLLPRSLLERPSSAQKEIERHATYFKFADDARAKLESRGLWVKKTEGSGEFEARPDAGEKLKTSFSLFLTSFVSFGSNNEVAKPAELLSGMVQYTQGGMSPLTVFSGTIFIFNAIVSQLKKAFPAQKDQLDQSGKFGYYSCSVAHSIASAIQPLVLEACHSSPDPISSIVLASIEILLGLYSSVTATESGLSRQKNKSVLLTELINAKAQAEVFFEKARKSESASPAEAQAYEKFMTTVGKLDEISGESKFASLVATISSIKEGLWLGASVVGNETAYKSLASTDIAVSNMELLGTAFGRGCIALLANVIDVAHGVAVAWRCQQRGDHAFGIREQLAGLLPTALPTIASFIKGLDRVLEKKIQDEQYEQGFSFFRIVKALVATVIGAVVVAALALSFVYTAAFIIPLVSGIVLAAFFIFLVARMIRTVDGVENEKAEEWAFTDWEAKSKTALNLKQSNSEIEQNKFHLLHRLSASLVDSAKSWEDESGLAPLFAALNFNEMDILLLRRLAQSEQDREKNISLVKTQLTRILNLKIVGA